MRRRQAFTLIEMMVSMALVIFVMLMLVQAFGAALETFSQLKGIGDMEDKLRTASTVMRRDLSAYHFDGGRRLSDPFFYQSGPPREGFFRIWEGSRSLPYIDAVTGKLIFPPNYEGADADGISSVRVTDRMLHFTVRLRGNNRSDFFVTDIKSDPAQLTAYPGSADSRYQDPNTYTCQTAEIAYFLQPNGNSANGTPLYTLFRRQLLTVPDNSNYNWPVTVGPPAQTPLLGRPSGSTPGLLVYDIWGRPAYAEVSCKPNPDSMQPIPPYIYFNSPADLTIPERRFGMDPNLPGGQFINGQATYPTLSQQWTSLANADALVSDVVSFDVKVFDPGPGILDPRFLPPPPPNPTPPPPYVLNYIPGTFNDLPKSANNTLFNAQAGVHVYDTWSDVQDPTTTGSDTYNYSVWNGPDPNYPFANNPVPPAQHPKRIPLMIPIRAIQIQIRVWDKKTQRTRQLTFVQDM